MFQIRAVLIILLLFPGCIQVNDRPVQAYFPDPPVNISERISEHLPLVEIRGGGESIKERLNNTTIMITTSEGGS